MIIEIALEYVLEQVLTLERIFFLKITLWWCINQIVDAEIYKFRVMSMVIT